MASKRQQPQDTSPPNARGGGQIIVKLCGMSEAGITFWSRHQFDVAAELQLRVRREALPAALRESIKSDDHGWASVRGFVVECRAVRRANGATAFRISLVLDVALTAPRPSLRDMPPPLPMCHAAPRVFGLN